MNVRTARRCSSRTLATAAYIVLMGMCSARQSKRATPVAHEEMATTDLKLESAGTLPRPGPIGRFVRLGFGVLCLWYVASLAEVSESLLGADGHIRSVVRNGILFGLFLVSYVINIGFSRSWKKWPAFVSAAAILVAAGFGYLVQGTIESGVLARVVWGWELYVFSHLGIAFFLAAVVGTPGCEMRAFQDFYSRITGAPTKEHYCPVGPLHPIDQWEARRNRAKL